MNRNRLNPYTATPSAPNGHRTRVRFLTTPELLTFNATTPGAARSDLWPRNGSHNFGGSPHASAWVAGLVPVARRDTTGAGSQKESFGHVHGRRLRGEFQAIFFYRSPRTRVPTFLDDRDGRVCTQEDKPPP
jgi:hypothetical protein